jgi:hypothetical protein
MFGSVFCITARAPCDTIAKFCGEPTNSANPECKATFYDVDAHKCCPTCLVSASSGNTPESPCADTGHGSPGRHSPPSPPPPPRPSPPPPPRPSPPAPPPPPPPPPPQVPVGGGGGGDRGEGGGYDYSRYYPPHEGYETPPSPPPPSPPPPSPPVSCSGSDDVYPSTCVCTCGVPAASDCYAASSESSLLSMRNCRCECRFS